eukprot:4733272-Amphidinium_carterae.1
MAAKGGPLLGLEASVCCLKAAACKSLERQAATASAQGWLDGPDEEACPVAEGGWTNVAPGSGRSGRSRHCALAVAPGTTGA